MEKQSFNDLERGAWKLAHARNHLRGYQRVGIRSFEDESLAIGLLSKLQKAVEAEQEVLTHIYHRVNPCCAGGSFHSSDCQAVR